MSRVKEEELEFISVNADDDNDMVSSYVDPSQPERTNNIIGNWIFNQSKVCFLEILNMFVDDSNII